MIAASRNLRRDNNDEGTWSGEVYVFRRSAESKWEYQYQFIASDTTPYDWFRTGLDADGDTAIIGAHQFNASDFGMAYIFQRKEMIPINDGTMAMWFRRNVARYKMERTFRWAGAGSSPFEANHLGQSFDSQHRGPWFALAHPTLGVTRMTLAQPGNWIRSAESRWPALAEWPARFLPSRHGRILS